MSRVATTSSKARAPPTLNPAKRKLGPATAARPASPAGSSSGSGRQPFGSARDGGFGDELYQTGIKDESGRIREFSSEDDACPICKTDRHANPRLRLLVSPCYHKLCEACVDKLFTLGAEPCPTPGCGRIIRKTNFIHQTFESLEVEKEVAIRKRIGGIYNKTKHDFATDREYDDYLEEIEDITFNLIEGIDRPATEARIATYVAANASLTAERALEARQDAEHARALEEADAEERAERMRAAIAEEEAEEREREEERREVMRALEEAGRAAMKRGEEVDADEVVRVVRERRRVAREAGQAAAAAEAEAAKRTRAPARRRLPGAIAADEPYTAHAPTSPAYEGPYVPLPYSRPWDPPHLLESTVPPGAMALDADRYVDVDSWAKMVKNEGKDGGGRYRGGGFVLSDVWRREMAMALDSLGVEMAA